MAIPPRRCAGNELNVPLMFPTGVCSRSHDVNVVGHGLEQVNTPASLYASLRESATFHHKRFV